MNPLGEKSTITAFVAELVKIARGLPGLRASLILFTPGVIAVTLDDAPIVSFSDDEVVAKTTA